MQAVSIKDFYVNMDIKIRGIEFDVSDDRHIGDLFVTKNGIIWCEGRTTRPYGRKIGWDELRKYCKDNP